MADHARFVGLSVAVESGFDADERSFKAVKDETDSCVD
jgi:hypothetical protein